MNILMVLTSHDALGDTGEKTGLWLAEFTGPYYCFIDAGMEVLLASPKGGKPPIDPLSEQPEAQDESTRRFEGDHQAQSLFAATRKVRDLDPADFDAVFYPGGHGPLWDLANDPYSIELIEHFYEQDKPIGAVCHGPAALCNAKQPDGRPLVSGKHLTAFSNAEERAADRLDKVPFLVETELRHHGGQYTKAPEWQEHVLLDHKLVTGQNPASSVGAAERLLDLLRPNPAVSEHSRRPLDSQRPSQGIGRSL